MKTNILLKNLIDLLFILMLPGILGFLFILPIGVFNTSIGNITVSNYDDAMNLPTLYWIGAVVAMLSYLLMLLAIWFLKKSALQFMDNDLLKVAVSDNLNKSGLYLILTAIGIMISYVSIWIANANNSGISLQYGDTIFIPLFLGIIGLFFKLIANTLTNARHIKKENDLTI